MTATLSPTDVVVSVTGYVCEVGHVDMGLRHGDPKAIGVTLECGERYVQITGLDKAEAKALSPFMRREVILRIVPVTKP